MNSNHIQSSFAKMGARLKVHEIPSRWNDGNVSWINPEDYSLDIRRDGQGQFFELRVPTHLSDTLNVTVMQNESRQRHLLLMVQGGDKPQQDRFLCGHDEREWFVAAVPGGASSVRQAMDALRPSPVHEALASHKVSTNKRYSRKNRAFRRQGEWFFIPAPGVVVDPLLVLRNEPLRRGAGKPHMVDELYRTGGVRVFVRHDYPNGITEEERALLIQSNPEAKHWGWRQMVRDASVYVRGRVRHSDHATITLPDWHRVVMNTETKARAMANVAFLD
jgi:hypothetical protein